MKKCILLSRVSTNIQDLSQQTNELIKEAQRQGYEEKQMIIIEDKESAIKLSEEERHGLNKLKEYISNDDDINCVICYEISRISRQAQMLYSVRDFLIEHKTQLIIMKPQMKLLDEEGKISQTANILFSLFSSISESEMMIKKERMKRGKRAKGAQNIWMGGNITFGYKVDETKHIVVDEEDAKLIKYIYNEYAKGSSNRRLARDIYERGELDRSYESIVAFVDTTLRRKQYYGDSSGLIYNYPKIISKELYDKCREMAAKDRRRCTSKTSMIYFCRGLLFNKQNMRMLTPCKSTRVYAMHNDEDNTSMALNINLMDSFIWYIVKRRIIFQTQGDDEISLLDDKITDAQKRIKTAKKHLNELDAQEERLEARILKGKISEKLADKFQNDIISKRDECNLSLDKLMTELNNYELMKADIINGMNMPKDFNLLADKDIKDIIDKEVDKVILRKTGVRGHYEADVIFKDGMIDIYYIISSSRFPKIYNEYNEREEVELLKRLPPRK